MKEELKQEAKEEAKESEAKMEEAKESGEIDEKMELTTMASTQQGNSSKSLESYGIMGLPERKRPTRRTAASNL